MRTIAVMNEKGGSGKTTTTISLAAVLAERRLSVLVVDLDPQASASLWLGRGREPGLYRAVADKGDLQPYVRQSAVAGIELIAGSRDLAAVDDLRGRIGIQTALKRALGKLGARWDVVLIDCPPNLGLLAVNALAAADEVLVPVETHGIAAIGRAIGQGPRHEPVQPHTAPPPLRAHRQLRPAARRIRPRPSARDGSRARR